MFELLITSLVLPAYQFDEGNLQITSAVVINVIPSGMTLVQ